MTWSFSQSTGILTAKDGEIVARGYAGGNCGKNRIGINNPECENLRSVGPLPKGLYTIMPPINSPHLGPFALPLKPDAENEMFGRSGFFCHGDNSQGNRSASEGCIIMPRAVRELMWASGDRRLQVVE